jgi:hypothetical protein
MRTTTLALATSLLPLALATETVMTNSDGAGDDRARLAISSIANAVVPKNAVLPSTANMHGKPFTEHAHA